MSRKSIVQFYANDHERLDELFWQFQHLKSTQLNEAGDRLREFDTGLRRHIAWEESILFPLFEEKTGMREAGPTAVMRSEHRTIEHLLDTIQGKVQGKNVTVDSEVSALVELLRAHNWKEENILYPTIDRQLSEEERGRVFLQMGQAGDDGYRPSGSTVAPVH